MKFANSRYRIQFLLLIYVIFLNEISTLPTEYVQTKNKRSLAFLSNFFGNLNMDEACVICRFVMQKLDKSVDSTRECAEIAQTEYIRAQQREWNPDQKFLYKWKMMADLKQKQEEERKKPFEHQDDHYYYVIHPSHINNYLPGKRPDFDDKIPSGGEGGGTKPCENGGDCSGNGNKLTGKKIITYNDFDPDEPFPHNLNIIHRMNPTPENPMNNFRTPVVTTGGDNYNYRNISTSSQTISNNNNDINIKNINAMNVMDSINNLKEKNSEAFNSFLKNRISAPRFKEGLEGDVNEFNNINSVKNVRVQTNFNDGSGGADDDFIAWGYSDTQLNPSAGGNKKIPKAPFQVDQYKLDRVFKNSGQKSRWNANPSSDNELTENVESNLKGQFIIDKNINRGETEPTSLLLPKTTFYKQGVSEEAGGRYGQLSNFGSNKITINNPRFLEQKSTYVTLAQSEYKGDQKKDISFDKGASPNFPKGSKRAVYPMINTDADRNEIMNTGIKFVGYGKALFPPHPEDLQPEIDCCTNEPCVEKKPCQTDIINLNLMNVMPKTSAFRFSEKNINFTGNNTNEVIDDDPNTEEKGTFINNNLKFAETEGGGVLFIPPPMMYDIPFLDQIPASNTQGEKSSFIQMSSSTLLEKKTGHHHSKSKKSISKSATESESSSISEKIVSEKTKDKRQKNKLTEQPVDLKILTAPSQIVEGVNNKNLSAVFEYNPSTGRRGRRRADLPDPEWDCLEKNLNDLIHFVCEHQVALSYVKYCKVLIDQKDAIVESFLYNESNSETCQAIHMCAYE